MQYTQESLPFDAFYTRYVNLVRHVLTEKYAAYQELHPRRRCP
jgi:hypothetical protein